MDKEGPTKPAFGRNTGMSQAAKVHLQKWFDGLGRPAMIPAKLKNDVMEEMRLHVDPAGISIWQLDRWIASQRRKSKYALGIAPSSRKKTERTEEQILFKLTKEELRNLNGLLKQTPNPSDATLTLWAGAPAFPNLTLEIAQKYIKYRAAKNQEENLPSGSHSRDVSPLPRPQPQPQPHLLTPSSTSPEPHATNFRFDPTSGLYIQDAKCGSQEIYSSNTPNTYYSKNDLFRGSSQEIGRNASGGSLMSVDSSELECDPNIRRRQLATPPPPSPISPIQHHSFPPSHRHTETTGLRRASVPPAALTMISSEQQRVSQQLGRLFGMTTLFRQTPNSGEISSLPPSDRLQLFREQSKDLHGRLQSGDLKSLGLLPQNELSVTSNPLRPPNMPP